MVHRLSFLIKLGYTLQRANDYVAIRDFHPKELFHPFVEAGYILHELFTPTDSCYTVPFLSQLGFYCRFLFQEPIMCNFQVLGTDIMRVTQVLAEIR